MLILSYTNIAFKRTKLSPYIQEESKHLLNGNYTCWDLKKKEVEGLYKDIVSKVSGRVSNTWQLIHKLLLAAVMGKSRNAYKLLLLSEGRFFVNCAYTAFGYCIREIN